MTHFLPPKSHQFTRRKIGFYTSVTGMGGSEVILADTMEAAAATGAEIVCWSDANAAIRQITASRWGRLTVQHRDWPMTCRPVNSIASDVIVKNKSIAHAGKKSLVAKVISWLWRMVPLVIKRHYGFCRVSQSFRRELIENCIDLLFVNVDGSESVSYACVGTGIPLVNCYHLSYTKSPGGLFNRLGDDIMRRRTIHSAQLTIHVSNAVRDQWSLKYGYPIDRTRVIYNGVEPIPLPERSATRAALNVDPESILFCVPGRFHEIKGHRYLIDALSLLKSEPQPFVVLLCGDGDLYQELEASVKSLGLTEVVRFLGWRSDARDIMHASDCTILPSTAENLSVAVIESLICGTPAIVTRVGGMPELIHEGRTGYVVPARDPVALAAAISRFMRHPDLHERMRVEAQIDARNRFSRNRMIADYIELFSELTHNFAGK